MIINRPGDVFEYEGVKYFIGQEIIGTDASEYKGLFGSISEIRTDADKDTENETPDIYCDFEPPVLPDEIKELEEHFSELYCEPKTLEEICLDSVIMAPEMIELVVADDELPKLEIYVLEEDWSKDYETGHNTMLFSSMAAAKREFNKSLAQEMNDGILSGLDDSDETDDEGCPEIGENSYEWWEDGFYCRNHYLIKITTVEVSMSPKVISAFVNAVNNTESKYNEEN